MVEKEQSRLAKYVGDRLEELKGTKTQTEVANEVGYKTPNVITMMKNGSFKLAIDKVEAMAKALDVEPKFLLRLALEQFYEPATVRMLFSIMDSSVTQNELRLLIALRDATGETDPRYSNEKIQNAVSVLTA